jgi:hypothetical protein
MTTGDGSSPEVVAISMWQTQKAMLCVHSGVLESSRIL